MVELKKFNKIVFIDYLTENLDLVVDTLNKNQFTIPVQTFKFGVK